MNRTFIIATLILFLSAAFPLHAAKKTKMVARAWTQGLKGGGSKKKYSPEASSPLVVGRRVLVGTHSSIFYALDAGNKGKILWQFKTNGPIASKASTDGETVFFGNNKGTVYALDLNTGALRWDSFVGGEVLTPPVLYGHLVYVVTTSREIYALDAGTGREKWSQYIKGYDKKVTMRGNSPILVSGGRLYTAFSDGQVAAVSAGDGGMIWSRNLVEGNPVFKDIDSALVDAGGYLFAVGFFGDLVKLEKGSGDVVWRVSAKSGSDIAADDENLYLSLDDGAVSAFDKAKGMRQWETPLVGAGRLSSPVLKGGYLLVGTDAGKVCLLDRQRGTLVYASKMGSSLPNNPAAEGSTVYFLSADASLVALQTGF